MKKSTQTRIKLFGGKASQNAKKILALLLGVVMLFGLLPGLLGAHDLDEGYVTHYEGKDNVPTKFQYTSGTQTFEASDDIFNGGVNDPLYDDTEDPKLIGVKEGIEQLRTYQKTPAVAATTSVYVFEGFLPEAATVGDGETIVIGGYTMTGLDAYAGADHTFATGATAGATILHVLNNQASGNAALYTYNFDGDDLVATAKTPGVPGAGALGALTGTGGLVIDPAGADGTREGTAAVLEGEFGSQGLRDDGLRFRVGSIAVGGTVIDLWFYTGSNDNILEEAYFVGGGSDGNDPADGYDSMDETQRRFGIIANRGDDADVGAGGWGDTIGDVRAIDVPYFAKTNKGASTIPGIMGDPATVTELQTTKWEPKLMKEIGSPIINVKEADGSDKLVDGKPVVDEDATFAAAVEWVLSDAFVEALNWYSVAAARADASKIAVGKTKEETGEFFQWSWDGTALVGEAQTDPTSKIVHEPGGGDRIRTSDPFGPLNPVWKDDDDGKTVQKGLIDWENIPVDYEKSPPAYRKGTPAEEAWIKLDFTKWGADTGTLPLKDLFGTKIRIAEPDDSKKTEKIFTLVEDIPSHILLDPDEALYWIDIGDCTSARSIAETVKKGIWDAVKLDDNKVPGLEGDAKKGFSKWTAGDPTFITQTTHIDYGKVIFYNETPGKTPDDKMPKIAFPYLQEIDGRVDVTDPDAGTVATFEFEPDIYVGRAVGSMKAADLEHTFTIDIGYASPITIRYRWISGTDLTGIIGVFDWDIGGKYRFACSNGDGWWAKEKSLTDAFLRCLNEASKEARFVEEDTVAGKVIPAHYLPYWIFSYGINYELKATRSIAGALPEGDEAKIEKFSLTNEAAFGDMTTLQNPKFKDITWKWGKNVKPSAADPSSALDGPVTVTAVKDGTDGETGTIILEFWELAKDVVGSKMEVDGLEIWFVKEGTKNADLPDGQLAIMVPNKVVVEKNDANVAWSVKELLDKWSDEWDEEAGKLDEDAFNLIVGGGEYTEAYLASVSKLALALRDIKVVYASGTRVLLENDKWGTYLGKALPYLPTIKLEGEAFGGDPDPDPVGWTISGKVIDGSTDDPIDGAELELLKWDEDEGNFLPTGYDVTSSATGEYLFEGIVDEEHYGIRAVAEGYVTCEFHWIWVEDDVTNYDLNLWPPDDNAHLWSIWYWLDEDHNWEKRTEVPDFDRDKTSYTVTLPHTTPKSTIVYVNRGSERYGAEILDEPEDPWGGYPLTSGVLNFKFTVTSTDGTETEVYTVKFEIEAPPKEDTPAPSGGGGGGGGKAAPAAPAIAPSKNATEFVTALYKIALGRDPDKGGLENWTGLITSGKMSPAVAVKHFLLAEETVAKNLSHAQFVELLYNIFMGRKSDKGGLDNWVGLLVEGMSRESVINHFFASPEFTAIQAAWK